jgi:hypothetical protein
MVSPGGARFVLFAADGLTNVVIGERGGVNHTTVTKWWRRLDGGLDAIEAVAVKTLADKRLTRRISTPEMATATGMTAQRSHGSRRPVTLPRHPGTPPNRAPKHRSVAVTQRRL